MPKPLKPLKSLESLELLKPLTPLKQPLISPSPTQPETITAKQSLFSIAQILQLTHHRNKNQHRLAKWWKQFSILRRNVSKLLAEVEVLETAEKFSGGGKGEKYVRDAKVDVERRVEFLEVCVLERAFVAFSSVVKDLQYASLGLMLLGLLARIKSVIRPLGKEQVEEQEGNEDEALAGVKQVVEFSREDENMQDLGEVVSREEIEIEHLEDHADEEEETIVAPKTPKVKQAISEIGPELESGSESRLKRRSKEEKRKKKRKTGDAFDDLFDSLI